MTMKKIIITIATILFMSSALMPLIQASVPVVEKENVKSQSSNKINWGDYTQYVEQKILAQWHPPKLDDPNESAYIIKIEKSGRMTSRQLNKSSGNTDFDESCQTAIDASAPFKPLPKAARQNHVYVEFRCAQKVAAKSPIENPLSIIWANFVNTYPSLF